MGKGRKIHFPSFCEKLHVGCIFQLLGGFWSECHEISVRGSTTWTQQECLSSSTAIFPLMQQKLWSCLAKLLYKRKACVNTAGQEGTRISQKIHLTKDQTTRHIWVESQQNSKVIFSLFFVVQSTNDLEITGAHACRGHTVWLFCLSGLCNVLNVSWQKGSASLIGWKNVAVFLTAKILDTRHKTRTNTCVSSLYFTQDTWYISLC